MDAPGQPFFDPEANQALFDAIEAAVHQNEIRKVRRLPLHINDPDFGAALVESFREIV
jgi:uncharacterized protein (UPF0261 family)